MTARSTDKGIMWICDACGKKIDPCNGAMSWAEPNGDRFDLHRGNDLDCWPLWQNLRRQGTLEFS